MSLYLESVFLWNFYFGLCPKIIEFVEVAKKNLLNKQLVCRIGDPLRLVICVEKVGKPNTRQNSSSCAGTCTVGKKTCKICSVMLRPRHQQDPSKYFNYHNKGVTWPQGFGNKVFSRSFQFGPVSGSGGHHFPRSRFQKKIRSRRRP